MNAEHGSAVSRRLYTCEECVVVIELVCDAAVPSVCALEGFGPPISDVGEAAISILCETFVRHVPVLALPRLARSSARTMTMPAAP